MQPGNLYRMRYSNQVPQSSSVLSFFFRAYQIALLLLVLLVVILIATYLWKKIQIMDDQREREWEREHETRRESARRRR